LRPKLKGLGYLKREIERKGEREIDSQIKNRKRIIVDRARDIN